MMKTITGKQGNFVNSNVAFHAVVHVQKTVGRIWSAVSLVGWFMEQRYMWHTLLWSLYNIWLVGWFMRPAWIAESML